MKAKYIGGEGLPGSGKTIVFGSIEVRCGETFDVPRSIWGRVAKHPAFQVIEDIQNIEVVSETPPPAPAPKPSRTKKDA